MDKRERSRIFRLRLKDRLKISGISRSALARACGVDRSTIALLLHEEETRLPNAHLAAECASVLGVSLDWLLGLTERSETASDLIETSFRLTEAERTSADAQIEEWLQESAGYKIRHVPATVPDILKTEAVLEFEYSNFIEKTPQQAMSASFNKVEWLRRPGSDYEICVSKEMLESLARGEGYWRGLSKTAREEQLRHMVTCCGELYPSLRVYLYDPKVMFSAPVTVFGPLLAVIYIGQYYMVFREPRQIEAFTTHFDRLVRDSEIDARSVIRYIDGLL